ncbi:hypothetical protein BH18ACT9_BH18ACT9_09900 [soil metagenome]
MQVPADKVDLVTGVGDVTADGLPDLLTRVRSTGMTQLRPGRLQSPFGSPMAAAETSAFAGSDLLAGAGNLAGTRHLDVVARDTRTHRLWVYPGQSEGRWGTRRLVLDEASGLKEVAAAGDLDGDGRADLLASTADSLLLLAGVRGGGLAPAVVLSRNWSGRDLTVAGQDLTGDGTPDLLARDRATGRTWISALAPDGRPGPRLGGWDSWTDLDRLTPVGDPGTGRARLVGRTSGGRLVVLDSLDKGWFESPTDTTRATADANFVQVAGDWDGDGHVDLLSRAATTGHVRLHRGNGDGTLMERTRLWSSWTGRSDLVVTGDLTGDELPDLIARDVADGSLYVYPSNGNGGATPRRLARPGLFATDLITAVGFWNSDGVRDLVVRNTVDRQLYLLPGTAAGGLGGPVKLTVGFGDYDRVVGVGDFDGDTHPDLVARKAATGQLWLLPGTPTGLAARTYLGGGMDRFDLIG